MCSWTETSSSIICSNALPSPYSNLISRCFDFEELLIIPKEGEYVVSRTFYILWRVTAWGRTTHCQRHRMSRSNPYTLACIWTVISIFPFVDKRDIFSSENTKPSTGSRKSGFWISSYSGRTRSLLWQSALQGTASIKCLCNSLVISSVHLGIQVHPTLPPSSSPHDLSDRFLPYILSPRRALLKAQHRCFTHCKHCIDAAHFTVWNFSRVWGSAGSANQKKWVGRVPQVLVNLLRPPWNIHLSFCTTHLSCFICWNGYGGKLISY